MVSENTTGEQSVKAIILIAAALLSGCATCERHPTACMVGGAVIAGTVVAMAAAHNGGQPPQPQTPSPRAWYVK